MNADDSSRCENCNAYLKVQERRTPVCPYCQQPHELPTTKGA